MISLSDLMPEPSPQELEEQFQSYLQRQQAEEQLSVAGYMADGTYIAITMPKLGA